MVFFVSDPVGKYANREIIGIWADWTSTEIPRVVRRRLANAAQRSNDMTQDLSPFARRFILYQFMS